MKKSQTEISAVSANQVQVFNPSEINTIDHSADHVNGTLFYGQVENQDGEEFGAPEAIAADKEGQADEMSIYNGKYAEDIIRSQISTNKNDEDHNDVISPRFPELEADNSAPIQVPIEILNSLKEKQQ